MTHDDHDQQLKALHAAIDRLTARVLQSTQDAARYKRRIEIMEQLPRDMSPAIDRTLIEQLLMAEGDQAAKQAAEDFPQFMSDVERRAQCRSED